MKKNIAQIKAAINERRAYLKQTYNVEDLGVFGSVARGENTENSDIDVLVKFGKPSGI